MDKRKLLFTALALAIACRCGTTLAEESSDGDRHVAPGIHEVADDELADMRGRYIVGDNTVVWFGVEMISTWQTSNGQTLQSALKLGLDFSKNPNQPQVTFVPTVTITTISNALPTSTTPSNVSRSVQSGGLANVGGLIQSVQIAGDHNAASNVTSLNIQDNGKAPTSFSTDNTSTPVSNSVSSNTAATPSSTASVTVTSPVADTHSSATSVASNNTSPPVSSDSSSTSNTAPPTVTTNVGTGNANGRYASAGNASASSTYSNDSAQVNLSVGGQGSVSQWIRQGSIGQTIALTTDNQIVTNQMIVSMVTQSINATNSQLAHTLAQSLNMNRSNR